MSRPILTDQQYYQRWQVLHGGYQLSTGSMVVRGWLRGVLVLARPLAQAGVAPDVVTCFAPLLAAVSLPLAALGGRWPLLAVLVIAVAGVIDNIDGAVAVLAERTTRWGAVLDAVVDRVTDAVLLLALWLAGAPAGVCVGAAAAVVALEYTRARAGLAGFTDIGLITLGERPTRITVGAIGLFCAGLYPSRAGLCVGLGAAATLGLSAVGFAQFGVVARRELTRDRSRGTDQPGHDPG